MFDKLKDMVPDMPDMPEMNLPDIPGTDLIPGMEKDEKAKDLNPQYCLLAGPLDPLVLPRSGRAPTSHGMLSATVTASRSSPRSLRRAICQGWRCWAGA